MRIKIEREAMNVVMDERGVVVLLKGNVVEYDRECVVCTFTSVDEKNEMDRKIEELEQELSDIRFHLRFGLYDKKESRTPSHASCSPVHIDEES